MKTNPKTILGIRWQPYNRFTFPVILHHLEQAKTDSYFQVKLVSSFHEVKALTETGVPVLLLYSFMTPHFPAVVEEVNRVRAQRTPRLKLLAGGPHASGDPASVLKAGFDFAYAGAAETGFSTVLERFLQTGFPETQQIFYAPELNNLDDSLPVSKYLTIRPPLEISRGCYWNCRFCQTAGQKARHRSLDSIKFYYLELKKTNYHRRMNFICPSAFEYGATDSRHLNYPAVEALLKYCVDNGSRFVEYGIFPSETRPDRFEEPFVALVARLCSNRKITIGAQSGSSRLLKQLNRGHSAEAVENACRIAFRNKLQPQVDIIFGFPGETSTDRRQTLEFIRHLAVAYRARVQVHYFMPLSGTPLENSVPTRLDYRTIDVLNRYQKDGICTGWWKEGTKLSRQVVALRQMLKDRKLEFEEIYL